MGGLRAALALALVAPALARTLDDFLREALSSCGYGTAGCNCTDVRAENRGLDGAIPGDLEACAPSLRILSVSGNKLTGPVPPWLLRGDHLWKAYLHANALSGPLPEAYGANLEWLSLYSNALTGPLPESLGELQHLRTFAVYENKLDGTVPASLVNLSRLEYLGLNANGFAGGLPGGPYGPMLRALWLQDNDFGGALPPAIGSCPLLEILDARNGGFDGPIPEAYGRDGALGTQPLIALPRLAGSSDAARSRRRMSLRRSRVDDQHRCKISRHHRECIIGR
ncbi:hypothetical protein SO694_00168012 [Aureococcus anophagefferens]|uniref:Leucine-rich repeat-containing N-terminal plant-type domain-containing protein n=1 Tax=Aureococcus anophagefferens TaxID=44056 RepID=A0ABR1G592_AURAN